MLQPAAPLLPPIRAETEPPLRASASELSRNLFGSATRSLTSSTSPTISGDEAQGRVSTDGGSLLGKSPAAIGVGVQRRTPIINDPRIRGSRVGSLAASGSYWIPARIDLDTMLSKIDSRVIDQIRIVPGPYDVRNGPALQSIQFDLLASPRYEGGSEVHGRTSADFLNNGEQLNGRQDIWGGDGDTGFRIGYGHRTGNDYLTGAGVAIPASFNSRDTLISLGRDLSPDSHVEFTYLRLDQTNLELPGQAFDIEYLATDSYEVQYFLEDQPYYDLLAATAWYNRTHFDGNAQRPGKRREFPFLNIISFRGTTDVDATSTGYRLAATWNQEAGELVAGTDLRFINQELNEITSGRIGNNIFTNRNSPIPDSNWVNPGIFLEQSTLLTEGWSVTLGARTDIVDTRIVDDPAKLAAVGTFNPPASFDEIVGTPIQDRTFGLWAAYVSSRFEREDGWSLTLQAGHAERAPSLTELYVAQSFMFLLQNGLNTVTGDPRLEAERLWQVDLALAHQGERLNAQVRGFHTWINDYITFENVGVTRGRPNNQVEQVNLKYVNTDLATLAGVEMLADYLWTDRLTPFATLQYVQGTDRTRNGDFATFPANPNAPSQRVPGRPRGFFSQVPGAATEALPQIAPLQSRLGLRVHEASSNPAWSLEIAARLVAAQDRVALSLLEQPTGSFAVGDIRAFWRATDTWTLLGGIENFTDNNYQEHLDFHTQPEALGLAVFQPGINFYLGAERNF